ncbi:cell wall metabolism sensor histidine kinase WalK [Desulfosporosinus sp. BICA1-9]|uniref:sensor histidine kinase n=1 Tax=Desulfosporosinus sp. BICA1-9 TaxID=1531958 RepID=UPI00054B4E67|nr:HAMP domain-containing sensor histidine kinase [Desulfosporosinus sp. BICA1-9]KJS46273.1 MAG: membrane protein [Peptococcaceae bacterium BRH_c23]KJS80754.1 MAG: membrane protein [Desulfosporosinus sp. BICA1-9]HBW35872.1 sensor histidine kinase [Desulfosporosinus sp.]
MRLKKRLIFANAATVIIPLIITVLIALAAFFIFGKLLGSEISFEKYQKQSIIKFELIKEANALSRSPELIEDEGFHKYLQEKLSEIKGEYALIKDDQIIHSSKNLSKIDVAKCLEVGNSITGREPVIIGEQSYQVQVIDFKSKEGSLGSVLLLEPVDKFASSFTSLLLIVVVSFILAFGLTNFIVSYQFSKSIIKPLLSLQSAAAEITRGNLNYPIVEEGDQEIQELCRDLELMRIKLKESVQTQLKYEDNRKMLISSISHDLKTPVTSIKGYVEGILDGIASNPDKMERYLRTIAAKTHQIDQMIDDLLLYAKLDLKQIPYNFERLDIEEYLLLCLLESEPELERRQIRISLHNELQKKQYLLIDRERMKRVIMNIFDNSRKYMNKEQGEINIFLRETFASVIIELRDNGSGISEEDLSRIFDRFYRSDPARSKGSGLGLAIAKQIIEGHKGRVWAVSHGTEGTSIMISLSKE